jgi:putative DNA modification/repair radical SAM protein
VELRQKLRVLADAAKYDASCASSGGQRRDSRRDGLGSVEGMGICHAYAPDGRCVSLLKILLTNFCLYDCLYCVNRRSSNVERARFTAAEVVDLTLGFYRRNYIEGLFLSSGIIRSADYTMEQLVAVARSLRVDHAFRGYVHLKTIPNASPELVREAGLWADRLSINVELPSEASLTRFAPEKDAAEIRGAMARLRLSIDENADDRRRIRSTPRFAPAGQSTQMIVGADATSDRGVLLASHDLYDRFRMRRVYYSAFSPIPDASSALPPAAPPLQREHRLYQADWLLRFYGFGVDEITPPEQDANLPLDVDPKTAWALRNRDRFPVDLNTEPRERLLRVPGLGVKSVDRLLAMRRHRRLRFDDLVKLKVATRRVAPFVITVDHRPVRETDSAALRPQLASPPRQASLFG